MTRSPIALALFFGLLPHAASVRTSTQALQESLSQQQKESESKEGSGIDWGTDKVCCCTDQGEDMKCYWQQRIKVDTGSGCNWVGKFNPWATKKRISGFTDGAKKKFYVFDVRTYGKKGQCELDQPTCEANELVYESKCMALTGSISLIADAHGGKHQFVRNDRLFADVPEAATAPVPEKKEAGSDAVAVPEEIVAPPQANVIVEDFVPEGLADPEDEDTNDVSAVMTAEDDQLEQANVGLTNRNLKKCERTKSKVFCSIACDMWPPVPTAAVTQKKGCHSTLKSSFSNAKKYCKNACSPDDSCVTPEGTSEKATDKKPCG